MTTIFPKRLKQERKYNELTQEKLAEMISKYTNTNVSRTSIARYENGTRTPDYDILVALSDVLDVDLDYLLGKSELKNYDMPLSQIDSFSETLKNYIIKDDKESNAMIHNTLDLLNLIFRDCEKKDLTLVSDLFNIVITAHLDLRRNRNIQYVRGGKEGLSSFEREEFKSLVVKDFSKMLDKIDAHYNSNDTEKNVFIKLNNDKYK